MSILAKSQTAGWIMMPLGKEVGLGPDDIVLDGDPAFPTEWGTAPRRFSVVVKRSPISATAELLFHFSPAYCTIMRRQCR